MNPNDIFPQLKDIKPPVEISSTPWLLIAIAVMVTIGAVTMLNVIFTRKKSSQKSLSPAEEALAALDKIRLEDLYRVPEAVAFYVGLSDALRRFLERQFGIHAPEMTTEEFLQSLQSHPRLADKHKAMIETFVRQCDLIKFARQAPDAAEARKNFEMVKDFIKHVI